MKNIIVGNWKCNPQTKKEAIKIFKDVQVRAKNFKRTEIIICPPFVYLPYFLKNGRVKIGAQNFYHQAGAFTGEISINMAKESGCGYAIVGHSERRRDFNETDRDANLKVKAALEAGVTPILCVGETIEEKARNRTLEIVKKELLSGLEGVKDISKVMVAYEPVWAVGAQQACSPEMAGEIGAFIRKTIENSWGAGASEKAVILYGGAVSDINAPYFIKQSKMNGLLIGRASLDPKQFLDIIRHCEE